MHVLQSNTDFLKETVTGIELSFIHSEEDVDVIDLRRSSICLGVCE